MRSASDWMKDLSGDLNVTQISIPGTHNSHAIENNVIADYKTPAILASQAFYNPALRMAAEIPTKIATCQIDPMWKQLQNGVRFLDLRVRSWEKFDSEGGRWGFGLCHGPAKLKESLTQVLDGMADFLGNHPSETLLISIKWDEAVLNGLSPKQTDPDDNLRHGVNEIWNKYGWFKGAHWPKLNEVRGRAILLRRFWNPPNESLGLNFYDPSFYDQERSNGSEGKWKQMPKPDRNALTIAERWSCARDMLQEAKNADFNDGVMYFSTTCDTWFDEKTFQFWVPFYYAQRLNPQLVLFMIDECKTPRKGRYGVVITDFCEPDTARSIFEQNFRP
ncbi:phosphatidylinositol diacylglycerol-lyase activity protein [Fusarium austroafricanum]|uniref:Phosphatidylinositol diacylglycerol-lyase activity protein n=1 Tax=Fusarium austroafricanum TaxID=2364996 RepID=A0A8H4KM44_9HYPO|nr:phosphatidylinositol diacylglycerol-lyase activity protein [Fusarium austroafricanum]